MKAQDKTMVRQMMTEGTEMLIEFIERMEAIQAAKLKADRKERKAKAKKRAIEAAKKRHPSSVSLRSIDEVLTEADAMLEIGRAARVIAERRPLAKQVASEFVPNPWDNPRVPE